MSNKKEIAETKNTVIVESDSQVTPMHMMQMALKEGSDVATMERLWALNEKVEAANAKKSYDLAMSQFKADPPKIEKDRHVEFGNTKYDHASLGNVVEKIGVRMGEHQLSHKWDVDQGEKIKVTCVVTHAQGHSESVSLESQADTSGSIKGIQAIASTISYLQRYTLLSITGLATQDMDDDGQTAEAAIIPPISEDEVNELDSMLVENEINRDTFKEWLFKDIGVETLSEVPNTHLARVRAAVKASIKAKNKDKK